MLEPGLKIASAGLNHRTRVEIIRRQFRERNLVEVVEGGKAMFARWPDVDMRAANVAVLEQRKPVEYRGGGNAVECGHHPAITQDTDIVERRLNSREHIANCGFGFVHRDQPSNLICLGRGAGEGTG